MNLAQIIADAEHDGVRLALCDQGTAIKATGDHDQLDHWLPVIRDNKAGIVALLSRYPDAQESPGAANGNLRAFAWTIHFTDRDPMIVTFSPEATHAEALAAYPGSVAAEPASDGGITPSTHLSASEESALQKWLASIGESDPATVSEMLRQCRTDAEARGYFLGRAGLVRSADPGDDRIRCAQCKNLTYGGVCSIARPGGTVSAQVGYRPAGATMLQRCVGYESKTSKGSTK